MTHSDGQRRTTALVTGASAGIGRELAKQFASHGHDLILVARNRDALEALTGTLEGKHGIKATVFDGCASLALLLSGQVGQLPQPDS